MQIKIKDLFITEGNLQEVATEDGLGYYPDLQLVAVNEANQYLVHPHVFAGSESALRCAEDLMYKVLNFGTINDAVWVQVEDNEWSYSKGNDEPYDSEEEYYMGAR